MKISFKIKLLFYWYKIFRSNNKIDSLIKISKGGEGVKRVAFLLPNDKKEAQLAAHFIKDDDKKNKLWDNDTHPEIPVKIGILGYGSLGSDAGDKLKYLGFDVIGYSLNKKQIDTTKIYYGDQIDEFLNKINILICTVPYTSKTNNLLSSDLFKKLNDDTYLINVSRGKVQNESDIIKYLENGKLSGAFLDVFEEEPLPISSKLWNHEKVQITPHNASITNQEAAVPQIIENYKRVISGKKLLNQVDSDNEY